MTVLDQELRRGQGFCRPIQINADLIAEVAAHSITPSCFAFLYS